MENISKNYTLLLITSKFPYGPGESFLTLEFPYLDHNFKKVIIISRDVKNPHYYKVPVDTRIYRYNDTSRWTQTLLIPLYVIRNPVITYRLIKDEFVYRNKSGFRIRNKNLLLLLRRILKALQLRDFINRVIRSENVTENLMLYSYWLNTGAHAIALFNYFNAVKIARGHGSEIYEEKSVTRFLPLLSYCSKSLNRIFFISVDGKEYFKNKFPQSEGNLIVSKLGVEIMPVPIEESRIQSGVFTIVTCSNIIPLKRVDLIIEALANVKCESLIKWYHFGDGPLRQNLEMKAATLFENNNRIKWQFMGQVKNEVLMSFYRDNQIDLFINTSSTEGLPVSIMEAQSFGIPVIATDVGGVREIVNSETGTLVPSDVSAINLASIIENYIAMDSTSKYNLRVNSLHNARISFDAKKNYEDFISQVNGILATFLTNEENRNEN